MLENVSGVCHIFYCDEKLQNNIQNRAKKKKDNHRKMPQNKKVLRNKKFTDTLLLLTISFKIMAQSNKFALSVSF